MSSTGSKTLGFLKSYVMTWGEWKEFLEFEPTAYGQAHGHVHILHEGMSVTAEELNVACRAASWPLLRGATSHQRQAGEGALIRNSTVCGGGN